MGTVHGKRNPPLQTCILHGRRSFSSVLTLERNPAVIGDILNRLINTQAEIRNARINTAGAYVCIHGFYLFAIGIHPHNGNIPIVRLGGHREEHETGWQCAVREVYEEANLHIRQLAPQRTYLSGGEHLSTELQEMEWQNKIEHDPAPCLVVSHRREGSIILSLMYHAQA